MTGSKVDMMLDSGVVLGVSMVAEVEEKSKVARLRCHVWAWQRSLAARG